MKGFNIQLHAAEIKIKRTPHRPPKQACLLDSRSQKPRRRGKRLKLVGEADSGTPLFHSSRGILAGRREGSMAHGRILAFQIVGQLEHC
jgi:hypothetical protein